MKRVLPVILFLFFAVGWARAETISVVIATDAAPRVEFGAQRLVDALKAVKLNAILEHERAAAQGEKQIIIGESTEHGLTSESFSLNSLDDGSISVTGGDDSGALYGCLELAQRIRAAGRLPERSGLH